MKDASVYSPSASFITVQCDFQTDEHFTKAKQIILEKIHQVDQDHNGLVEGSCGVHVGAEKAGLPTIRVRSR